MEVTGTFETIAKRHSYRGAFADRPVPREDLVRILEAGLQAPSGKNLQTTRFIAVDDPGLVRRIGSMHHMAAMQTARALIICLVDDPVDPSAGDFPVEDCAAAVMNMLLALTALGYASVWIDGWLRNQGHARTIGDILGVPQGKLPRVLLPLGVPAEAACPPDKLPFEQRAWLNKYNGSR